MFRKESGCLACLFCDCTGFKSYVVHRNCKVYKGRYNIDGTLAKSVSDSYVEEVFSDVAKAKEFYSNWSTHFHPTINSNTTKLIGKTGGSIGKFKMTQYVPEFAEKKLQTYRRLDNKKPLFGCAVCFKELSPDETETFHVVYENGRNDVPNVICVNCILSYLKCDTSEQITFKAWSENQ